MSQYPEDLFDQKPADAAALEQARLEAQKVQADKGSLPDPKDNPTYSVKEKTVVTPADVQNAHEVVARNTAAAALSYPTGSSTEAEANIANVKEKFGIVEPGV